MAEERVASLRGGGEGGGGDAGAGASAELRALVLEQYAAPRASAAKVAMSQGLNADMVHGRRKHARERDGTTVAPRPEPEALPARSCTDLPHFVPASVTTGPPPAAPADIQIELRRGATAAKITWPVAAAGDCAAWTRELLR